MQGYYDPIERLVDEIKGTAEIVAKVLFAGVNIVFILVLSIIIISNLSVK